MREGITVSVCMIVKNEEKVLARCLDSLKGLYEELVIVDTGSTDSTKEIAAGYTDKIYDFTWTGSFADARNLSFSKATMEYIYTADADEILNEENRQKFLKLKQCLLPEIDIVQMIYTNQLEFNTTYNYDEELRPKLYKRLRTFEWVEPLHEQVRLEPVVYDSEIKIIHAPENNHSKRDFSCYKKLIESGEKLSKHLFGMYVRELYIAGDETDFIEAEPYFLKEIEVRESIDEIVKAALVLIRAARYQGNALGLLKYSSRIFALAAEHSTGVLVPSELCYELGEYYLGVNEKAEAKMWFTNALTETDSIISIDCGGKLPEERLKGLEKIK
jgi:hypothetical protein